jgi:hypothetical protein
MTIAYYVVSLVVLIVLVALLIYLSKPSHETMIDLKYDPHDHPSWNRNTCDYMLNQTIADVLANNNITKSSTNWTLQLPCGYDEIKKELGIMPTKDNAKYFIIDNIDVMTAKEMLWANVIRHHGLKKALTMMPMTYILYQDYDIKRFDKEYDSSKIYIIKKNIQRQEGIKITQNKNEIINGHHDNYVVAQELLQDPYIIGNRKINMRFYVLIVCQGPNIDIYVYNNGFMYYTKDYFKPNSAEIESNITTGYIDRHVYEINPLTHDDFKAYLDNSERKITTPEYHIRQQGLHISQIVFNRIYKLLSEVFISFVGQICNLEKIYNNVKFQLFGIDIAINDQLNPMIMEINKGPDMGAKDKRDSEVKHNVVTDMFDILGMISPDKLTNRGKNGFIKILDIENNNVRYSL